MGQERMKLEQEERRYKMLYVRHGRIAELIVGMYSQQCVSIPDFSDCIPEGTELRGVHYYPAYDAFGFCLFNEQFEKIPLPMAIPSIEGAGDVTMRVFDIVDEDKLVERKTETSGADKLGPESMLIDADLGFSVRARKVLNKWGIITVGQFLELTELQCLQVKYCGAYTTREILRKQEQLREEMAG